MVFLSESLISVILRGGGLSVVALYQVDEPLVASRPYLLVSLHIDVRHHICVEIALHNSQLMIAAITLQCSVGKYELRSVLAAHACLQ